MLALGSSYLSFNIKAEKDITACKAEKIHKITTIFTQNDNLKVSYFQNEFMKTSFLPKYEQKIVRISALTTQGRNPDNFLFVFWEK